MSVKQMTVAEGAGMASMDSEENENLLQHLLPLFEISIPEKGLAVFEKRLEMVYKEAEHLPPIEEERDEEKASVEPQLLEADREILCPLEVASVENGLVEDVRLEEEPRLAAPHVLPEVDLTDSGGDLPDLPSVEPTIHKLRPVLLLILPHPHVRLEHLLELLLPDLSVDSSYISNPTELLLRALHQPTEHRRHLLRTHPLCFCFCLFLNKQSSPFLHSGCAKCGSDVPTTTFL